MRIRPGDRLLIAALVVFGIGLLATATMFAVPALDHGHRASVWVYALTLGLPVGFVLALVYALRSGRRTPPDRQSADGHDRQAQS